MEITTLGPALKVDLLRNKTECWCLCVHAPWDSPGFPPPSCFEGSACANTRLLSHIYDFLMQCSIMIYARGAVKHEVRRAHCSAHGLELWITIAFLTTSHIKCTENSLGAILSLGYSQNVVPVLHSHLWVSLQRSYADPAVESWL